ncbi:hypothetical protein BURPS305_0007 [Burkholderia pseudomallei 305]|nr:hypothetical protein BURPS305_0007 [Burkholderia pseudomallei 305]
MLKTVLKTCTSGSVMVATTPQAAKQQTSRMKGRSLSL